MKHHQRQDPLNQAIEFWETIVHHRWGILFATAVLSAVSVVAIALWPDTYVANTTVLFDPQKLPERYVAPTVMADPAQRLNTLTQEVLSTGRLQQIIQQLQIADPRKTSQEALNDLRKGITIEETKPNNEREMSAFVITYGGQDPQLVAAVANRLAQSFIDWDLANREQQVTATTQFMSAQLQDAKQALDVEEAKIGEYKRRHPGELPEQLQSNMQALATLHLNLQANGEALDRLEQEKTMLTVVPESHTPTAASSEHDRLETERRTLEAQLTQLRAQYTEQYPDVVNTRDRLKAVTKQLQQGTPSTASVSSAEVRLQMLQRETERLQAEQKELNQRINKYQAKIDATPLRGQELETLSHNYANARQQYEGMLDKKFHAGMAMDLERQQKASRFTVDPAQVPERPVKPNRLLLLAMTLPFCGLLPAGLAIAGTELRGTVNSERALRSLLPDATRVVGRIPMIETPLDTRRRVRLATFSILGSFLCCAAVAAFLLGGTAAHMRRNHAHQFAPSNPSAELSPR